MKSSYFDSIIRQFSLQKASYLTRQPICYSVLLAKSCLFIKPQSAYRNEATKDQFLFYLWESAELKSLSQKSSLNM